MLQNFQSSVKSVEQMREICFLGGRTKLKQLVADLCKEIPEYKIKTREADRKKKFGIETSRIQLISFYLNPKICSSTSSKILMIQTCLFS